MFARPREPTATAHAVSPIPMMLKIIAKARRMAFHAQVRSCSYREAREKGMLRTGVGMHPDTEIIQAGFPRNGGHGVYIVAKTRNMVKTVIGNYLDCDLDCGLENKDRSTSQKAPQK